MKYTLLFLALLGCGGGDTYVGGDLKCVNRGDGTQNCTDGSGNAVESPCSNQQYRDQSGDPNCANYQPRDSGNTTSTTTNPPPSS